MTASKSTCTAESKGKAVRLMFISQKSCAANHQHGLAGRGQGERRSLNKKPLGTMQRLPLTNLIMLDARIAEHKQPEVAGLRFFILTDFTALTAVCAPD